MAERRLYIHVGPHKTGTTTIQRGLLANRSRLKEMGYDFPNVVFNFGGHHNLVSDLKNLERYQTWLGGLKELTEHAVNTDGHMIISSEEFDRIVTPPPLEKLKKALGGIFDIHIIGYLRPQEELLQSLWQTEVKMLNLRDDFGVWLPKALEEFPFLKYDEWISVFEDVFGRDNIQFNIYDPGAEDLLLRFLGDCGISDLSGIEPHKRANVSQPGLSFELIRQLYIYPFVERTQKRGKSVTAMLLPFHKIAKVVDKFAKTEGIDLGYSAYDLETLKSVRERFRPHNQKTAKTYFGRARLFEQKNRLRAIPGGKLSDQLSPEQVLRLCGALIEMEQAKTYAKPGTVPNPELKEKRRQRVKLPPSSAAPD